MGTGLGSVLWSTSTLKSLPTLCRSAPQAQQLFGDTTYSSASLLGALRLHLRFRRTTGVKRSAFGRLSGRQRSYADEVEGGEERQRLGNGRSHNKPLRGLPAGVCSPLPQRKGSAACLRDIPCGNVVSRWTFGERDSSTPATWRSSGLASG